MRRSRGSAVASISRAPVAHSEDVNRRTVRYLVTMGIRTACLLIAVVAHGPLRWAAITGAVVLPYLAVIAANVAGDSRVGPGVEAADPAGSGTGPSMAGLPPGVAERVWPSRFATPPIGASRPAAQEGSVRPGLGTTRGPGAAESVDSPEDGTPPNE